MNPKKQIAPKDLGIDLAGKSEQELFKWFLACLLLGHRIAQQTAKSIYLELLKAGITAPQDVVETGWNKLVELLDAGHESRHDYSTATLLIEVCHQLQHEHGSLQNLLNESQTSKEASIKLQNLKGVGPATARIFLAEVGPLWYGGETAPDEYEVARQAAKLLTQAGFETYIIGGAVRDLMLGHIPKDFDLATSARPEQIIKIAGLEKAKYKDPAQAYGVTRVRLMGHELEIATFRKDIKAHQGRKATEVEFAGLEEDMARRDFTVNALALDPLTNQVIDYQDGLADIEDRLVRFIGDPQARIREDPLRILRAIRFKNMLGFEYHAQTSEAIKQAVAEAVVEDIAVDRLRHELTLMLLHVSRKEAVADLDEFGLLAEILPEVTAGKGVAQPPEYHAEGDVWTHQLLTLDALPEHPSRQLAWAALLHDIGKPPTQTMPKDRIRFNDHYGVGADLARQILRRLKFSKEDTNNISWMIYHHMNIDDLPAMTPAHRTLMLGHPAFGDLLELHRADATASWRKDKPKTKLKFPGLEKLWHDYLVVPPAQRRPSLKNDLGIDGAWLMDKLGLPPGPDIGKILGILQEWYEDEGVQDKEAYIKKAKELLSTDD